MIAIYRHNSVSHTDIDSGFLMHLVKDIGNKLAHGSLKKAGSAFDDGHLLSKPHSRRGDFKSDESAPDNHNVRRSDELGSKVDRVRDRAKVTNPFKIPARYSKASGT
jgi:hypothetical protein